MNIAIIPARGGSKRIPRKNIKDFCGKPMIAYAISAAKESGLFDHIVVSTDDDEIAQISREYGAETPFVRPDELANDFTETVPVIVHAIEKCLGIGWALENVCCIYPNVPFIRIDDIRSALDLMNSKEANYCFPVTEFPSAIQRALNLLHTSRIQPFYPEFEHIRTQDLLPAYYDAGQFYWGNFNTWLTEEKIHSNGLGYFIPKWRVVDIDTPDDWQRAELIYSSIINKTGML
jgi:pseudaminic acid cytidylyltransferase